MRSRVLYLVQLFVDCCSKRRRGGRLDIFNQPSLRLPLEHPPERARRVASIIEDRVNNLAKIKAEATEVVEDLSFQGSGEDDGSRGGE